MALGEHSEPEPDIAIAPRSPEDYRAHHPSTAALVVEIADTTLDFDRSRKQEVYAQAKIREYWIVNLVDGVRRIAGARTPGGGPAALRPQYPPSR